MLFSAVVAAFVSVVYAERFTVAVGQDGGLTYTPTSVTAQAGDTLAFRFMSKNHTLTQSTFAKPCEPMTSPAAGIDSGFLPVSAGATNFPEWSFTLEAVTGPLWFFCAQTLHCSKGMVFAVNPTANKTYEAFKATAMGQSAAPSGGSGTASTSGADSTSVTAIASATVSTYGNSAPASTTSTSGSTTAIDIAEMVTGNGAVLLAAFGLAAGLVL